MHKLALLAKQDQYGLEATMVVLGVKMIYVPWMPGHVKRLSQRYVILIAAPWQQHLVIMLLSDLTCSESSYNTGVHPAKPIL